jgi:hypothetical protein
MRMHARHADSGDDVAQLVKRFAARRKLTFKEVVNDALRAGLATLTEAGRPKRQSFRIRPVSLGRPRLPNLDDIAEVLVIAAGDRRR